MLINGIDIATYGAEYLKKDIQTAEVVTYKDWLRNAPNYIVQAQQEQYKVITCDLIVKGTDDDDILQKISNLIKHAESCTIQFDGTTFLYDAALKDKSHKRIISTNYELHIEWEAGYAYQAEITETFAGVTSKTINVSGNLKTPATIEITPTINLAEITVAGMTIQNLTASQTVIVSTEDFTVLQNGVNKYGDTSGDFPFLIPGNNTITVSDTNSSIDIKYKPRWL